MTTSGGVLIVEQTGGVALVTLNRPDALNSLTVELKVALRDALAELAADDTVRAVVLTGAGRGFCAGQDLREHTAALQANDPAPLSTVTEHYNPITLSIATMPKPVIAAVNGIAAGAGAGFAFAADIRLASNTAAFLLAFANIGLTLDSGSSWTLPRIVGAGRAAALALLAEKIDASDAMQMGMVSAVLEPDLLLPAALQMAGKLAAGPTAAYAAIKQSLAAGATGSLAESLAVEAGLQASAGETEDHRSAVAAFVAKQQPTFVGR